MWLASNYRPINSLIKIENKICFTFILQYPQFMYPVRQGVASQDVNVMRRSTDDLWMKKSFLQHIEMSCIM